MYVVFQKQMFEIKQFWNRLTQYSFTKNFLTPYGHMLFTPLNASRGSFGPRNI